MGNPIDDFFRWLDRLIRGIQRETARGFADATYLLVMQAILDTFVSVLIGPYGFIVDICFMGYTGYGFYDEIRGVLKARTVIRLVLAVFAFLLDIWLTLNL